MVMSPFPAIRRVIMPPRGLLWTTSSECYSPSTYLLGMGCQSHCWGGGLACAAHDRTEQTNCASQVMIYGPETTDSQQMENKHRVDLGKAWDYFWSFWFWFSVKQADFIKWSVLIIVHVVPHIPHPWVSYIHVHIYSCTRLTFYFR